MGGESHQPLTPEWGEAKSKFSIAENEKEIKMSQICVRIKRNAPDNNKIILENWSDDARVWCETYGATYLTPDQAREFAAKLIEAAELVDAKGQAADSD